MTEREQAALRVDPWGDGKGDDHYRVLRNQILTTRKPAQCILCFLTIPAGSRVRAQTEQSDDYGVKTFKFCPACVEAMAAYNLDDDFKKLEARYAIGRALVQSAKDVQNASVAPLKQTTDDHDL